MAFPTLVGTPVTGTAGAATTTFTAADSAGDMLLPASRTAGSLLIATVAQNSATYYVSTPTGWNVVAGPVLRGSRRFHCWARVSTADTNDNLVIDRSSGGASLAVQIFEVTGWYGTLATGVAGTASTGEDTFNISAHDASGWGAANDYLWFIGATCGVATTGSPTGYGTTYQAYSAGVTDRNVLAFRSNNATSEDPGDWPDSAYQSWAGGCFVIRPAEGGTSVAPLAMGAYSRMRNG